MNKEELKNKFKEVKDTVKESFTKDTTTSRHRNESELKNKDYLGGAVDQVKEKFKDTPQNPNRKAS